MPDSPAIEAQAHAMVAKLTLEQKIELIGGVDSMYTHAIPAIGLPRFKMSDASVGVRTWGPTTAYAGGVALAATWDRDFARTLGASLGKDARARSVNFLLGPGVNIARSPIAGRNFEYLSEDPYLNSTIVVPYIEGLQSQGVIATVKHYALNDQEFDRHNASSDIDERTMREIYLPAFEAAVIKGHVDSVMNSYNLVNGVHATQNEFLNLKVLKGEWGFKGMLMSDWDATYDGVAAANNGLDLEMPSPQFMNAKNLLPAVKDGTVKESTIDDKVLRLIRTELRYGFTDSPAVRSSRFHLLSCRTRRRLEGGIGEHHPLEERRPSAAARPGQNQDHRRSSAPMHGRRSQAAAGPSEATGLRAGRILTGIANLVGPNVRVLYSRGLPEINGRLPRNQWDGEVKVASLPQPGLHRHAGNHHVAQHRRLEGRSVASRAAPDASQHPLYRRPTRLLKAGKYLILAALSPASRRLQGAVDGKQVLDQAPRRRPVIRPVHGPRSERRPDRQHCRRLSTPCRRRPLRPGHRL